MGLVLLTLIKKLLSGNPRARKALDRTNLLVRLRPNLL